MDIVHLMHPQHLIFGFELFGYIFIFGKLKSATSKRYVPLNDTAIEMILDLRKEFYFGENSPLIPDENGIKQKDGSIKSLTPRQVADLLGHTTSEITELYYVKRDLTKLNGLTDGFEI